MSSDQNETFHSLFFCYSATFGEKFCFPTPPWWCCLTRRRGKSAFWWVIDVRSKRNFSKLILMLSRNFWRKKFFFFAAPLPLVGDRGNWYFYGLYYSGTFSALKSRITYVSVSVLSEHILLNYIN